MTPSDPPETGQGALGQVPVEPQGADAPLTRSAVFLVLLVADRDGAVDTVRDVLADVDGLVKTVGFRDLLGFVDGTANPVGPELPASTLVGDEDPAFAGGSYVVVQKYLHSLAAWQSLTTERQEAIIGRRKADGVELGRLGLELFAGVALVADHRDPASECRRWRTGHVDGNRRTSGCGRRNSRSRRRRPPKRTEPQEDHRRSGRA